MAVTVRQPSSAPLALASVANDLLNFAGSQRAADIARKEKERAYQLDLRKVLAEEMHKEAQAKKLAMETQMLGNQFQAAQGMGDSLADIQAALQGGRVVENAPDSWAGANAAFEQGTHELVPSYSREPVDLSEALAGYMQFGGPGQSSQNMDRALAIMSANQMAMQDPANLAAISALAQGENLTPTVSGDTVLNPITGETSVTAAAEAEAAKAGAGYGKVPTLSKDAAKAYKPLVQSKADAIFGQGVDLPSGFAFQVTQEAMQIANERGIPMDQAIDLVLREYTHTPEWGADKMTRGGGGRAAAVAEIKQAYPNATPEQIEATLQAWGR